MTCTCGQRPHLQACALEVVRRRRRDELLDAALEHIRRRQTGQRFFRTEAHALGWFFKTREAWASPKALPLARGLDAGDGTPSQGADDPKRVAFAAIAYAVKLAVEDAGRDGPALAYWIEQHHGRGRAYAWIVEEGRSPHTLDQMKRRMARAHRLIRERLEEGGFLE